MSSVGWPLVGWTGIGGRMPLFRSTTWYNACAAPSKLQVHFNFQIEAMSGGEGEAKSTMSGGFAGLSALKEDLESRAQAGSGAGSGGFAGLSALEEEMMFEKRATPASLSIDTKKKVHDNDSHEKKRESVSLIVSNLAKEVTRAEYESLMQQIPEISDCKLLEDKSGRCRGYGFCEVHPGADLSAIMELLRSKTLGGRVLKASFATGRKELSKDANHDEVRPKSVIDKWKAGGAPIPAKTRPISSSSDVKRKPAIENLKANLRLEGRARRDVQEQQLINFTSSDGGGPRKNSKDFWKQRNDDVLEPPEFEYQSGVAKTTIADGDGRLSGQSVLAALERFAVAGRTRQRRAKGNASRSASSGPEDGIENSDEPQFIEFKLEWAERIQSLESSIEQLKRS